MNTMKEHIQRLNAKTFDQDELIKNKLTSLEKMESELLHLHDDVEKVKEVQTTSENNKEDISEIKTQMQGLAKMNVMVTAQVLGVYNGQNAKSSRTSKF